MFPIIFGTLLLVLAIAVIIVVLSMCVHNKGSYNLPNDNFVNPTNEINIQNSNKKISKVSNDSNDLFVICSEDGKMSNSTKNLIPEFADVEKCGPLIIQQQYSPRHVIYENTNRANSFENISQIKKEQPETKSKMECEEIIYQNEFEIKEDRIRKTSLYENSSTSNSQISPCQGNLVLTRCHSDALPTISPTRVPMRAYSNAQHYKSRVQNVIEPFPIKSTPKNPQKCIQTPIPTHGQVNTVQSNVQQNSYMDDVTIKNTQFQPIFENSQVNPLSAKRCRSELVLNSTPDSIALSYDSLTIGRKDMIDDLNFGYARPNFRKNLSKYYACNNSFSNLITPPNSAIGIGITDSCFNFSPKNTGRKLSSASVLTSRDHCINGLHGLSVAHSKNKRTRKYSTENSMANQFASELQPNTYAKINSEINYKKIDEESSSGTVAFPNYNKDSETIRKESQSSDVSESHENSLYDMCEIPFQNAETKFVSKINSDEQYGNRTSDDDDHLMHENSIYDSIDVTSSNNLSNYESRNIELLNSRGNNTSGDSNQSAAFSSSDFESGSQISSPKDEKDSVYYDSMTLMKIESFRSNVGEKNTDYEQISEPQINTDFQNYMNPMDGYTNLNHFPNLQRPSDSSFNGQGSLDDSQNSLNRVSAYNDNTNNNGTPELKVISRNMHNYEKISEFGVIPKTCSEIGPF